MANETVFNPRHLGMTGKGLLPVRRKGKRENKKIKYKKKKMYSHPLSDWMAGPQYLGMAEKGYCQYIGTIKKYKKNPQTL